MNKKLNYVLYLIILFIWIFMIGGCSGGGMASPSSPDMPDGTSDNDVSGNWTGTWGSYEAGGESGTIDTLEFIQVDNGNGSYSLSGTLTLTGTHPEEGTISTGTYDGNTSVTWTATFGDSNITWTFDGTYQNGSISGTYRSYQAGQETDYGNFILYEDTETEAN